MTSELNMSAAEKALMQASESVRSDNALSNLRLEELVKAHMLEDTATHKTQQEFFEKVMPIIETHNAALTIGHFGKWAIATILSILALYSGLKGLFHN
jgi:hypothetical protein